MTELSIIIPGIRPHLWNRVYDSIVTSIDDYKFEVIFVGPDMPSDLHRDAIFIRSYMCPSACVQMAALTARGRLVMWGSDDCLFLPHKLAESITLFDAYNSSYRNRSNIVALRYCEGTNFSGSEQTHPEQYYDTQYHGPWFQLPGVPKHYKICLIGMISLYYFKDVGGLDCRYEHINWCLHDLAFRCQNDGGEILLSNGLVMTADFDPNDNSPERSPVIQAHWQNDWPLFQKEYSESRPLRRGIDYDNWQNAERIWKRRFK